MARKVCRWKNGRRCQKADCPIPKGFCDECSDYEAPEVHVETVIEHLANGMNPYNAAVLIVKKVNELGYADRLSRWLSKDWEESDGKA